MFSQIPGVSFENAKRIDNRANGQFIQTVLEQDRRDKILENVFLRSTAENPYHKAVRSSIDISTELKEERRQRFLDEKRRQQLRENNQELKQLEVQLRAAYVSKTLAAQNAERDALREQERALKHQEDEILEQARLRQEEFQRQKEEEQRHKKDSIRKSLLEQMADAREKKMVQYEEFLDDKRAMDNMRQKIAEEDIQEVKKIAELKQQAKLEMDEFMRQQEDWLNKQKAATQEENERINNILRERELEQECQKREKQEIKAYKEKISERIGNEIHSIEDSKRKHEEILLDLLIEERKAKEDIKFRQDMERKLRDRIDVRLELDRHREEATRLKVQQQKEEDHRYHEEQMRLLAERDKLEQMSNEKRRRKILEHRRSLQEALEEKKRVRADRMVSMIQERERDENEEKRRQQLIAEERIRMLKEHASSLSGFLPPGVLRDSDREYLALPPAKQI